MITRNTNDAKNLQSRLSHYGISSIILPAKSEYISYSALQEAVFSHQKYSRKMAVLIARLLFWRYKNQSESLAHFRSYGEERALISQFRMSENESCDEYEYFKEQSKNTQITLINAHTFAQSRFDDIHSFVFKDATLME